MQTTGVRIHGAGDVRMETFELPKLGAHELLARVVTDSMCMSTYKAVMQGSAHRCIPDDIAEHPCLIGHELCAVVEQVGEALQGQYQVGEVFTAQPKMYRDGKVVGLGYTFPYYGGDATHTIIPQEAIDALVAAIEEAKQSDTWKEFTHNAAYDERPIPAPGEETVEFCHNIGLTYVSCSPFRVPIARLAAAQAAIRNPRQ